MAGIPSGVCATPGIPVVSRQPGASTRVGRLYRRCMARARSHAVRFAWPHLDTPMERVDLLTGLAFSLGRRWAGFTVSADRFPVAPDAKTRAENETARRGRADGGQKEGSGR